MKTIPILLALGMIILLGTGVFAASTIVSNVGTGELSDELTNFVSKVAEKKGVEPGKIESVRQVDFAELPQNVDLKNIDDTNLALYEINTGEGPLVYMLTVSDSTFKKTLSSEDYKRSFLNFGFVGESSGSHFLKTATGVETSFEKGYVMTRSGTITGISTNLEVVKGIGEIEIIILKNGESVGLSNDIKVNSAGVKLDHDIQSEIVSFKGGDVISVYIKAEDISWKDVTTLVEITTKD